MSADNEIIILKKKNGLYEVRHSSASSLVHELEGIEPTLDELKLSTIADDVKTEAEAFEIAHKVEQEWAEEGIEVEYGIRIIK